MKLQSVFLAIAILLCISMAVAHPHFQRTSNISMGEGQDVTITHVTFPWNEANPERMPAGGWTVGGAKVANSMALTSGSTSIPAGEYGLKINKEGKGFSMQLVDGEKTFDLETKNTTGLADQDHLMIDIHVTGEAGFVVLRYGTFSVASKIQASH